MNKDVLAYAFHKYVNMELNDDGTINVGPSYPNFQPLPEWDDLMLTVRFDPSLTVSRTANNPCGHLGIKTADGKCFMCKKARDALAAERRKLREVVKEPSEVVQRRAELQRKLVEANAVVNDIKEQLRSLVSAIPDVVAPSRADALRTGARWYMPAEPCKYCGQTAPRYVANGRCRSCG